MTGNLCGMSYNPHSCFANCAETDTLVEWFASFSGQDVKEFCPTSVVIGNHIVEQSPPRPLTLMLRGSPHGPNPDNIPRVL